MDPETGKLESHTPEQVADEKKEEYVSVLGKIILHDEPAGDEQIMKYIENKFDNIEMEDNEYLDDKHSIKKITIYNRPSHGYTHQLSSTGQCSGVSHPIRYFILTNEHFFKCSR